MMIFSVAISSQEQIGTPPATHPAARGMVNQTKIACGGGAFEQSEKAIPPTKTHANGRRVKPCTRLSINDKSLSPWGFRT